MKNILINISQTSLSGFSLEICITRVETIASVSLLITCARVCVCVCEWRQTNSHTHTHKKSYHIPGRKNIYIKYLKKADSCRVRTATRTLQTRIDGILIQNSRKKNKHFLWGRFNSLPRVTVSNLKAKNWNDPGVGILKNFVTEQVR